MDEITKAISSLKRAFVVFGLLALTVAITYVQGTIIRVFILYCTSIVIAVLLKWFTDIIVQYIHLRYSIALLIVIAILTGLLVLLCLIAGPSFTTQLQNLSTLISKAIVSIRDKLDNYDWGQKILSQAKPNNFFSMGVGFLGNISQMIGKIFDAFGEAIFVLLMGIFLALEPNLYVENIVRLFYPSKREQKKELIDAIYVSMCNWLLTRFIAMVIVGVFTIIGLEIARVPLPFLLGIIAGLFTFIPFVGAILSAIPAILVGFTISPSRSLWVILIYLIVHFIEDIITPVIQEKVASLPPALLLSTQILFTIIGGPIGLLISAPITLVIILAIQVLYLKGHLNEKVSLLGLYSKSKNQHKKM